MKKIRVAVNGYGTIGKRVADAVRKQKDMEFSVGEVQIQMIMNADSERRGRT